jgi:hypothetical protein
MCFLQAQSCWCVARLRSWHHILVTWCKMWISCQAIKMRTQVFALLSLSIIIMLVCVSYGGGLGSKVALMEQDMIKVLRLHQQGPKTVRGIAPAAVQRLAALYQMPPRSKGPGTSTVPWKSAKLRGLRDLRILHPPGILAGFWRSCLCAHVMHANTCYQYATRHLVYPSTRDSLLTTASSRGGPDGRFQHNRSR